MTIFTGKPGLAGYLHGHLIRGFGAKCYRLDALPDANQQKRWTSTFMHPLQFLKGKGHHISQ